ncbi:hypothetical protein [Mycobacterium sp.]|uniref:hypothetical protein n=1 Tax=Mycobacterium sp. TaxID=1785 RepID=UPI002BCA742E|nr:hypothetical protein [Mycobacterium sp.]HME48552.1 hypothetical protein [Mycobacterium sp.]
MSWHYSTDMSRGGDPYNTPEPEFSDDVDDQVEDYDAFIAPESGRWRWVAAVAGAVLLIAVVGTIVIVTGGDSASTTARVVPSESRPVYTPPPPKPSPSTSLPPETVTTLTPSTTSPSTADAAPSSEPPPAETAPPPAADTQTLIYTVSGTKQPFDPVTVTYTDETGALRTDFDVSLPWSKKLVLSGNALVNSVTAVSFASHLNCTISDGNGQTLVSQTYNTIAATCNR